MFQLFPDPGKIPTLPPPQLGEKITIDVEGVPPIKDVHFSHRNPRHKKYSDFVRLRQEATRVMASRAWYEGPVEVFLTVRAASLDQTLDDYISGIADTLDGSHGFDFTYLPI